MDRALTLGATSPIESTITVTLGVMLAAFLGTLAILRVARRSRARRARPAIPPTARASAPAAFPPRGGGALGPSPTPRPTPPAPAPSASRGQEAARVATAPQAPAGLSFEAWTALIEEVAREEGVLGETRGRLSPRRSLQSLLASIRDRDLLYERGERIGRQVYAASYADLAERLTLNRVSGEVEFRKAPGEAIHARLAGTAAAREAPVVGMCLCFIEAGLLAGALANLEGQAFEVRETRCAAKGDPVCEFRAEPAKEPPKRWEEDPAGLTGAKS